MFLDLFSFITAYRVNQLAHKTFPLKIHHITIEYNNYILQQKVENKHVCKPLTSTVDGVTSQTTQICKLCNILSV